MEDIQFHFNRGELTRGLLLRGVVRQRYGHGHHSESKEDRN